MYSRYAALCGCIPIVVPIEGVSKQEWHPEKELRYGIAYGSGDVEWALQTREEPRARLLKRKTCRQYV